MPRYAVSENGKVYLDHKLIGSIDLKTGALDLPERVLKAKIAVMVIKSEAFDVLVKGPPDPGREHDRPRPLIEVFREQEASSLLGPDSREEYASSQPPPPPPMDPRLGDKTPAFMTWLGTYFPEKYRERYKGRKTHLNTGQQPQVGLMGQDIPDNQFRHEPEEEWR